MHIRPHVAASPQAAAERCARHITGLLEQALVGQQFATLAVSGGSGPKLLLERLAATAFPWSQVHFFWVDERVVPPTDPRSNFRLAAESLLNPAGVPKANIHRVHTELTPAAAAQAYSEEICTYFGLAPGEMPRFDVIHLGLGEDVHTASLFPGSPLIEDRQGIAAAVHVNAEPPDRVTLLPGVLLAAAHLVFLATGSGKAGAVRAAAEEPYTPSRYPAQLPARKGRAVSWFIDTAAGSLLAEE